MVELNVSAPNTAMAVILGIVVFAILLFCCVVLQFRLSRRRARLVPPAAMAKPPEGAGFIEVDTGGFGDATEKGELDDSILSSVRQQENEKEPGGRIAPVGGRIKPFEEAVAGSGAGARGHGVPAGEGVADNTAADTPETSAPAEKRSFWGRFFGGKQKTKGARVGADVESGEAAAETCGLEQPSAAWPGGDDSKYGGRRGEGLSSEAGTEEEAMSGCEGVLTGQGTESREVPSVAVSFAGSAEADGARTSAQMQGGQEDGVASRVAAHSLGQLRDRSVERGLGPTVQPQSGLAPVVSVYDHQAVERSIQDAKAAARSAGAHVADTQQTPPPMPDQVPRSIRLSRLKPLPPLEADRDDHVSLQVPDNIGNRITGLNLSADNSQN